MNTKHVVSAVFCAFAMSTSALAAFDGFNRIDLGPKWEVAEPGLHITNNRLRGEEYSSGQFLPAAADYSASMIVRLKGTDLGFGAIIIGDAATSPHAFVKVQSQNGLGTFSHAAFYDARFGVGPFFALEDDVAEHDKLLMTVSMSGTMATLSIDLDMDGTPEYVYGYNYGTSFGSGIGVGVRGVSSVDKLRTGTTNPSRVPTRALPVNLGTGADLAR